MPIFISYSHQDKEFVDKLAIQLVAERHHVWMDRWELSLGDSLSQKVQTALTGADAILVIVSKHSIQSEWFKRELSAGLVRELEERKTLVMPCIIDDCEVPLFLRDKLYADFKRNPDEAFRLVNQSLARISNPLQGRIEDPQFHTDWSVVWLEKDDRMNVEWTFIDHGHEWPYVILTRCQVLCDLTTSKRFKDAQKKNKQNDELRDMLARILASLKDDKLTETIGSTAEKFVAWKIRAIAGRGELSILITCRRLGIDNGMDTLVHIDPKLRRAHEEMSKKLTSPSHRS